MKIDIYVHCISTQCMFLRVPGVDIEVPIIAFVYSYKTLIYDLQMLFG